MPPQAHLALPSSPAADDTVGFSDTLGLITVCAWCGRPLGRGLSARRMISHGICRSCSDEVLFADSTELLTRR